MATDSQPTSPASGPHAGHHEGHHPPGGMGHIVPVGILAGVLAVLLVLTYITVAASNPDLHLGALAIWIALTIATIKAAFVVLYFMHLRYDRPFNAIVLITSLAFVALFIGLALMDSKQYQGDLIGGPAPAVQRQP